MGLRIPSAQNCKSLYIPCLSSPASCYTQSNKQKILLKYSSNFPARTNLIRHRRVKSPLFVIHSRTKPEPFRIFSCKVILCIYLWKWELMHKIPLLMWRIYWLRNGWREVFLSGCEWSIRDVSSLSRSWDLYCCHTKRGLGRTGLLFGVTLTTKSYPCTMVRDLSLI